jgi:two-component system, NarL family, response regulator NreC
MTIRLLLVDDHRMMREGLRSLLEAHGGLEVVAEADNGRDAVRKARGVKPDVVVMDIGMKDLNGVEATRQLRAELPRVPVVVLSTYAHEDYVLRALEAGASAYVLKISAPGELVEAIESVAKGRRFLSPEITGLVVDAGVQGARIARDPGSPLLTGREQEVLQLVAEGRTSGEIATSLHLSTRTVEQHRRRIMEKLDLHSVAELTRYAIRKGIISLDE